MYLKNSEVMHALEKAREMSEHYKQLVLSPDALPRSVDELLELCIQRLGKKIIPKDLEIPGEGRHVKGLFLAYDDRYEIFVLAGLDPFLRRFVVCKEIFHVLLDEEPNRTMNIYGHLEEVTSTFLVEGSTPNGAAACEKIAEVAAMEFLIPLEDRIAMLKANGGSVDVPRTAARYHVPERYVESYCSEAAFSYFARIGANPG